MVAFTQLLVLVSSIISTFAAPPFLTKREGYDDVVEYMGKIKTQVSALDGTIAAFPAQGGTLVQGLAIHNSATELSYQLGNWTEHTTALGSFTAEQCREQLDSVISFRPQIESSLVGIVEKKAPIAALPIGGIVNLIKLDLGILDGKTGALADAMIVACPEEMKDEPRATKEKIAGWFDVAIAAYA